MEKKNSITLIMTKDIISVSPEQFLLDVKHIYEKEPFHHHIPVVENGELVGIISLIDFMYNIKKAGINDDHEIYKELRAKDIMTQKLFSLTTNATIEDAAKLLIEGRYHAIPILEKKNIVGIVTTADIIKFFLNDVS